MSNDYSKIKKEVEVAMPGGSRTVFPSRIECAEYFMISPSQINSILNSDKNYSLEEYSKKLHTIKEMKEFGNLCLHEGCYDRADPGKYRQKYCSEHSKPYYARKRQYKSVKKHDEAIRSGEKVRGVRVYVPTVDFLNSDRPEECKTCGNYLRVCLNRLIENKQLPEDKSDCYVKMAGSSLKTNLQAGGAISASPNGVTYK